MGFISTRPAIRHVLHGRSRSLAENAKIVIGSKPVLSQSLELAVLVVRSWALGRRCPMLVNLTHLNSDKRAFHEPRFMNRRIE
jgi:hypothetical protein